jgi:branched-chain amino acid aminotransferase
MMAWRWSWVVRIAHRHQWSCHWPDLKHPWRVQSKPSRGILKTGIIHRNAIPLSAENVLEVSPGAADTALRFQHGPERITMEYPVWFNGELKAHADCTVHVRSHAIHYGSSVFEGIRAYDTPGGTMVFRLTDHLERLFWSASVYRIPIPYTLQELHDACRDTVRAAGLSSAYIRPVVLRGDCGLGVIPNQIDKVEVAVMVTQWGTHLGEGALEDGIDACISSWQRLAPNTVPAAVKAGGNYLSSQLIGFEAADRGFREGIALGVDGHLSEGAGENIFVVRKGRITTPPASASILCGITRDTVFALAESLGLEVVEQNLSREQLYAADEVFMTGTAVEITPVRRIDHMPIGDGKRGAVTRQLQQAFFGLFDSSTRDQWGWLEPV